MAEQPFISIDGTTYNIIKPFFNPTATRTVEKINTVILHWTAGSSVGGDVRTLQRKGYGYHFLIDKDGTIYQGSPVTKKLSHAGNSYGPNGNYNNTTSVGISFSTRGDEKKEVGSTKFNKAQIKSAITIISDLKALLPNLKYISGHHWVSPGRKVDPYTFPFDELMTTPYGGIFGVWTKTLKSEGLELWKTGYAPFPSGLSDCKCIEKFSDGNCKKSTGSCKGPGGYGYSERKLSTEVSDLSFESDLLTN